MNDLTLVTDHSQLKTLAGTAVSLFESGLLPKSIKTPQAATMIMMRGLELGLPGVASLGLIHVVEGKTELAGTTMQALLQRAEIAIQTIESTSEIARLRMSRRIGDFDVSEEYQFTLAEAKAAGLTGKDNWRGYAKDMLYWRALSRGARRIGADVIHGCYVTGEVSEAPEVVKIETIAVDAPSVPQIATVPDSPKEPAAPVTPTYADRIAAAPDTAALFAIGLELSREPDDIRAPLREVYEARRQAIVEGAK